MTGEKDLTDAFLSDLAQHYGIRPRARKRTTILATLIRLRRTPQLSRTVLVRNFNGIGPAMTKFGETRIIDLFVRGLPLLQLSGECSLEQSELSQEADARAAPYGIDRHLAEQFPDRRASWLMKDADFERYVHRPGATKYGRCFPSSGCHQFAAPTPVIRNAIARSVVVHRDGSHHDPKILANALGLQPDNMTGPLRLMTLDLKRHPTCTRLPVESDPGALNCDHHQHPAESACFRFGGFTSGGIPEVMLIDAPVKGTRVQKIK